MRYQWRVTGALGLVVAVTGLPQAGAQTLSTPAANVVHLPQYIPGRTGPVLVISGIESARELKSGEAYAASQPSPSTSFVTLTQPAGNAPQVDGQQATGNSPPTTATVRLTQPQASHVQESRIVVQVQRGDESQPNQESQIQRRAEPPARGPTNRGAPTREPAAGESGRGAPAQPEARRNEWTPGNMPQPRQEDRRREASDRDGADRHDEDREPPSRGGQPSPWRPSIMRGGPAFTPPGPVYDGLPRASMSPHQPDSLSQQVESLDRVIESSVVQRILELKEENLELKASMKILEAQVGARQEIAELQTRMMREQAERALDSARQIQRDMELRTRGQQARSEAAQDPRRGDERLERATSDARERAPREEERAAAMERQEGALLELKQLVAKERELSAKLKRELEASERGKAELDHRIRALEAKLKQAERNSSRDADRDASKMLSESKRESAKQIEGAKREAGEKRKEASAKEESKPKSDKKGDDGNKDK